VEVEGIGAGAGDLDVLGFVAHALDGLGDVEGEFCLIGADEDEDAEALEVQGAEGVGLNILEIDEDVVHSHRGDGIRLLCDVGGGVAYQELCEGGG
jgi:hypothetical protein